MARLVKRARDATTSLQEQHAAFGEIVRLLQHVVFGIALATLRDDEDAKDATQEAFITAWRRLRQLREPSALVPWLRKLVATTCARRRRMRREHSDTEALRAASVEPNDRAVDYRSVVAGALTGLPRGEREAVVLFYFLGYTAPQIGKLMRLKPGTVGKRLHSARLRIRRGLPRSVRTEFLRVSGAPGFSERVSRGLLDEYVGEYRFRSRPRLPVMIAREGNTLVSTANGQRHVLVSIGDRSLLTATYDGEGRFGRNRKGEVTHFVYYEFGRRMGVAYRVPAAVALSGRRRTKPPTRAKAKK